MKNQDRTGGAQTSTTSQNTSQKASANASQKPFGTREQSELNLNDESNTDEFAQDQNEGEGSRTAARRYNDATTRYARSGKVEPSARDAAESLDSEEGDELRDAEERAKAGLDTANNRQR